MEVYSDGAVLIASCRPCLQIQPCIKIVGIGASTHRFVGCLTLFSVAVNEKWGLGKFQRGQVYCNRDYYPYYYFLLVII